MSKPTIILLCLVQIGITATDYKQMAMEILMFTLFIGLGSGVTIARRYKKKQIQTNKDIATVVFLGFAAGAITVVLMDYYKILFPKYAACFIVALSSEILFTQWDVYLPKFIRKVLDIKLDQSIENELDKNKEDNIEGG